MSGELEEDEEVIKTTSFLAKKLMITERIDGDGEREDPLFLGGKILSPFFFGARRIKEVFNGVEEQKTLDGKGD